MPNSGSATKKSAAAVHDDNNEVSNDDFNMMMGKKLNEFKSTIISELIENMEVLIQSEFQNTIQKYKNQLEEVCLTLAMFQHHVTNLKQENSNLQERTRIDRQDLERYYEENKQYSRRLCLRIKNMKKQENESSEEVLEEIKCLFSEASINIPDACFDRAYRVSRTDDTVTVRFTKFRHRTMFYRKRKELKNGVKVHLDLTKARLDLLIKASKYVKNLSNVDFVYADINCRLQIYFSNNNESFFDSMDNLISKTEGFPNEI